MPNPKLLQQIDVSAAITFGFTQGGAQTADVAADTYDTILELLAELEDALQVVDATFTVTCSSLGVISIACTNAWVASWGTTDDDLEQMMGFAGSESVIGSGPYTLTAAKRHLFGWYSPVGCEWQGSKRTMSRRYQPTDDGDATVYGGTGVRREAELAFDTLLEAQIEPEQAGVADDGAGGSVDWTDRTFYDFWEDTNSKRFRFYHDCADGTVADPGADGDEYWLCVRTDEDNEPSQTDPLGYTYFRVELPIQRVTA